MSKPIYKSKTFWFFLLYLAVSVAGVFGFAGWQPTSEQSEIVSIVVAIVGILLRFLSKVPVTL